MQIEKANKESKHQPKNSLFKRVMIAINLNLKIRFFLPELALHSYSGKIIIIIMKNLESE